MCRRNNLARGRGARPNPDISPKLTVVNGPPKSALVLASSATLAVVLLAGCASGTTVQDAAASLSRAKAGGTLTSSSSAPAGPWSTSLSQDEFQAMVVPVVSDLTEFQKLPTAASVAQIVPLAALIATDEKTLSSKVASGLWPASAKSAMATLATALAAESRVFEQVSVASSINAVHAAEASGPQRHSMVLVATANARVAIGLPAE
jgi:hypothetical protein